MRPTVHDIAAVAGVSLATVDRVLNQRGVAFTDSYGGHGRWGDAVKWRAHARELGLTVSPVPVAGSVAWYGATKAAPDGHVAYVEKVLSAYQEVTLTLAGALLLLGGAYAEDAAPVIPDAVKWRTYPLADGVQVSALYGGAEKEGLYSLRVKMQNGARLDPHPSGYADDHGAIGQAHCRPRRQIRCCQRDGCSGRWLLRGAGRHAALYPRC